MGFKCPVCAEDFKQDKEKWADGQAKSENITGG
jgi:hypothetical protein